MQKKKTMCRHDGQQMPEIKGKSTQEVKLHRICKESRHMRESKYGMKDKVHQRDRHELQGEP